MIRPLRPLPALLSLAALLAGCTTARQAPETPVNGHSAAAESSPPMAPRKEHTTEIHGTVLSDHYYWLRERANPETIAYLEAENAYAQAVLRPTEAFQSSLFEEMLGRIQEDDQGLPFRLGEYWYYYRTETGKEYPIWCRKKGSLEADEEIFLDENAVSEGHDYTDVGNFEISDDHRWMAWTVDHDGDEIYELRIRDLFTGEDLPEVLSNGSYALAWAADNETLFYTQVDEQTRPFQVWRHRRGSPQEEDVMVFEEANDAFFASISRTRSRDYLLISSNSAVTSEVYFIHAETPEHEPTLVAPRAPNIEYGVEHHGDRFFILTNEDALNFKLMQTQVSTPAPRHWTEVIPHRDDVELLDVEAFAGHLTVLEREKGLPRVVVRTIGEDGSLGEPSPLVFEEEAYDLWLDDNHEFDTTTLRFAYTSLVTPISIYDHDMLTGERELKKQRPVIGYDKSLYTSERILARASDGTQVPISLMRRTDTPLDGSAPLLLYGYGAYGIPSEPYFSSTRLSLVDRGMIYAIAHVRGGGEMGRRWKEDGKFEHKTNTFTDFIACAEHLIEEQYTSPDRIAVEGWSAGGMLVGAVINMRPDLFRVAFAGVPFVDVLNTMLDESIPLTVTEWEEWGNPNEPEWFEILRGYSPYDNVREQEYPHLLVRAGLNDPRVGYWEPAKWVARLRSSHTGDQTILLVTNMGAGHGGASGRYGWLRERALDYAFLLDRLGLAPDAAGEPAEEDRPRSPERE